MPIETTVISRQSKWTRARLWLRDDFFGVVKLFRLSYLPPLMVYFAAGVSGFTLIVETFFIKEELGLTAAFIASIGFWAGLPWAFKMPLGHLVDLYWRFKSYLVYLGAALMALSLLIMVGLTGNRIWMETMMSAEYWYVLAAILAPLGFVMQDVVADAMTVEAVPLYRDDGKEYEEAELKEMHVTMQTLGRIAIIGGSAIVAGLGGWLASVYSFETMYLLSLFIPVISVTGILFAKILSIKKERKLRRKGVSEKEIIKRTQIIFKRPLINWYILGGGALFIIFTAIIGLSDFNFKEEAVFIVSLGIIIFLVKKLLESLTPEKRREIVGIAVIIFIFRAMPTAGAGSSWWQIDVLGFNEAFFGTLRQISAILAIIGMLALRGWMTRRSIPYLVVFLSIFSAAMTLPFLAMFYGLHEWTMSTFGFGARAIAIIDTMADSPLGQVAMIPMLAWIAREAPRASKATYFAVMSAFTNLALSMSNLNTEYLNKFFTVERGYYDELGALYITLIVIVLVVPILAVWWFRPRAVRR